MSGVRYQPVGVADDECEQPPDGDERAQRHRSRLLRVAWETNQSVNQSVNQSITRSAAGAAPPQEINVESTGGPIGAQIYQVHSCILAPLSCRKRTLIPWVLSTHALDLVLDLPLDPLPDLAVDPPTDLNP